MAVLDSHKESVQRYLQVIEQPEQIDTYPFQELPAGTSARDLSDGGKLFLFSDGSNILFNLEGSLVAPNARGETSALEPSGGNRIMLSDGRELKLAPKAIHVTHESTGIEGLPQGVEPIKVAATRYRIDLPSGVRIDVEQQRKIVMVCDVSGSILAVGIDKTEGYAEEVEVSLLDNGSKGFQAKETGHKGMVEADGTVHLSLAQGDDLIFRFPGSADDPVNQEVDPPKQFCEGRNS